MLLSHYKLRDCLLVSLTAPDICFGAKRTALASFSEAGYR
jgi:hypothetical protein